jgi:hypothetical protein
MRVIDSNGHFHEPHYLFDEFIDMAGRFYNL